VAREARLIARDDSKLMACGSVAQAPIVFVSARGELT
jgi:hypothetical protein